jgi:acyl-CoA synthetase (AMP-forming)/AMP-acid ligase II
MTDAQVPSAELTRIEDAVAGWAREMPESVAALSLASGHSITWGELDPAADRLVSLFGQRGLVPVTASGGWASMTPPSSCSVARRRARLVLVGLNWRLPASEVRRAKSMQSTRTGHCPWRRLSDSDLPDLPGQGRRIGSWDDLPRGQSREPDPRDPVTMFFTSGATGEPKAVVLDRHAQELAVNEPAAFTFRAGDRQLILPPQFHLAGAIWSQYGLLHGTTQVYLGDSSPPGLVRALAEQRITHALMVPTLLQMVVSELEDNPTTLPCLGDIAYGASPIPAPLLRRVLEVLPCRLSQVYGLSEAGGVVVELAPADHDPDSPHLLAAGRPVNTTELKIVDAVTGAPVEVGQVGEIVVRCDHMMTGYWNAPDRTAAAMRDGWLYTKDAGRLDAAGFVYIEGRIDDMIITGGENVQPADVERVIVEFDGVAECAVFGVPHEKWGTSVWAAVVSEPGAARPGRRHRVCRLRLAGYQCPKVSSVMHCHEARPALGAAVAA